MKDQERLAALEFQMSTLVNSQREFSAKVLQMLALGSKDIYSKEEAALFLNLDPDYIYQLKHQGKLQAIPKKKGQKKIYFKKEDLEAYLLGEEIEENESKEYEKFEKGILDKWR